MKQFILTQEMLNVLGDSSQERINVITKCLTHNWAFIVYPESCPDNFIQILEENFIPFALSPLHDKDVNADGSPKKPHYHVLICSEGKKSFSQLFDIAKSVNGTNLINVQNARGYYRYLTHEDNPEKYHYNQSDIRLYCGFVSSIYDKPISSQRYQYISDMCEFISVNNVLEFCDFLNYCRCEHFNDWFPLLCDNSAVIITNFITSVRNKHFRDINNSSI